MTLLSGPTGCVHGRIIAVTAVESGEDMIGELPDGKALAAPQIDHASIGFAIR